MNTWDVVRQEFGEFPDLTHTLRLLLRLLVAVVLGAVIGWERQLAGKPAGLRTHMLTTFGAALFVMASQSAGMDSADLSRVIQGILTGIGFIGGGTIIKLKDEHVVQGVTTAASIWVAAGVGVAAGLGRLWTAILGTAVAFLVLSVVGRYERRLFHKHSKSILDPNNPHAPGDTSG